MELAAVAVHCLHLEPPAEERVLAGAQEVVEARAVDPPESRRDDGLGELAPDHLVARPAEVALGLLVPIDDPAIGLSRDERFVGGLEDRSVLDEASANLEPRAMDREAQGARDDQPEEGLHQLFPRQVMRNKTTINAGAARVTNTPATETSSWARVP